MSKESFTVDEVQKQVRLFVPAVITGDGIVADHESFEPTSDAADVAADVKSVSP